MLNVQLTSNLEAGTDEAGRGCLAGPVTAAAVILPLTIQLPLLNDSKKLTKKQRYELRPMIEKYSISFGIANVFQEEIDKIAKSFSLNNKKQDENFKEALKVTCRKFTKEKTGKRPITNINLVRI